MSTLGDPSGFALRKNGSCFADTERSCGDTVAPFTACCPKGSFCPSQYNVACCPSAANCTQILVETPKCANDSWNLFNNNGYFCCEPETTGYATKDNTDGCAVKGFKFSTDDALLPTLSFGTVSAATSTSASSSTSPTQSSSSVPATKTSKTNTGAIAGGVVGGVAGVVIIAALLWWLFGRKARRQSQPTPDAQPTSNDKSPGASELKVPSELEGQNRLLELEDQPVHELP